MRTIFTNCSIHNSSSWTETNASTSAREVDHEQRQALPMHNQSLNDKNDVLVINDDHIEYAGSRESMPAAIAEAIARETHNRRSTTPANTAMTTIAADMNNGHDTLNVVDLEGRSILPSFIDGHMHLLLYGQSLSKVNIEHCRNLAEIRTVISEAAASEAWKDKARILCKGWREAQTDGVALASMLNGLDVTGRAGGERPIFVESRSLHFTWCNSVALEEMNVSELPDPPAGTIHRDELTGKPSGLMAEAANIMIVWPHLAKVASVEEKVTWIEDALREYRRAGYTGLVEMAMDENAWEALWVLLKRQNLEGDGESDEGRVKRRKGLQMRIAVHWLVLPSKTSEENLAQVERAIELHRKYNKTTSPNLRIAGIKLMLDGVIDSCTAALLEPYTSNAQMTDPVWPADHIREVVQRADEAGLQCALHAIGDAAVRLAVDTLEAVGTRGRRHRIEHLEVSHPQEAARLGELGITASIQPVHSGPETGRAWLKHIGPDRLKRAFAYQEFASHGAILAIGTDAPTATHHPFPNLYTAITRRSAREPETKDSWNEQCALTLGQAINAATYGSAYSCFAEQSVGSLEPGKKADFVVVDWTSNPEDLLQAKVRQTWFDGHCAYDAGTDVEAI